MVKNINNIIITQCSGPIFQPNGLYYFLKTVCDGDRIKQKKNAPRGVVVIVLCVCVRVYFISSKKKMYTQNPSPARPGIHTHQTCVEHTRRVAVLGI